MLRPSSASIEYNLLDTALVLPQSAELDLSSNETARYWLYENGDLELVCTPDEECSRISIVPKRKLQLIKCKLNYTFDAPQNGRYLLNGYQSWTDTTELSEYSIMRGLDYTPRSLVDRYTLKGSGDYDFAEYSITPGVFHGWTYGYIRTNETCELIGSLDESRGFLHIDVDVSKGAVSLSPECPVVALEKGVETELGSFSIIEREAVDECFNRWFELNGINVRTKTPLIGYTSWYRHYENIDADKLKGDLSSSKKVFNEIDTEGFNVAFQIDDGFAKVGDWLKPSKDDFPEGMAALADKIDEAGFIPGLWLAPFVCESESELVKEHPDWIAHNRNGKRVKTGPHWSGGLALDILNPEVEEYVRTVIRTVTREWGFKLLKLDFLYAACIVPHGGLNRGELMHKAMQMLRDEAGEDVLLLGCGVPLASAFGVVDYCRIGCDVGPDWNGQFYMRPLHRERVSTKRSLSNTVYRTQLNGRAFLNDPDVVFLRDDVKLSDSQKQLLLDGASSLAGVMMCSDDMSAWNESTMEKYTNALIFLREANR